MSGRTGWEILTGKNKPKPVEGQYPNPLELKIGGNVTVNTIDYGRNLLTVGEIWSWDRKINGKTFNMTDYFLRSAGANVLIRVFPRENPNDELKYHVLVMTQYYPKEPGPLGWCEESPDILAAADDVTGEFFNNKGQDNEEKYWRIGGKIAIPCTVHVIKDENGDGKIDTKEVSHVPYTLWDFHRETLDEANQKMVQYLYVQLCGKFVNPTTVNGGDKTIIMYSGEEIPPQNIMAF
jgi:hypothetical protein